MTLDGHALMCAAYECGSDAIDRVELGVAVPGSPGVYEMVAETGFCGGHGSITDLIVVQAEALELVEGAPIRVYVTGLVR